MKHHIYITPEGVIRWIKEMPEYPAAANDSIYFADVYQKALERAKAESIPFSEADADYVYNLILQQHKVSPHPHGLNVAPRLREGIYPIELDADIVSVSKNCQSIGCNCGGKVAKITPKKAEESEGHCLTTHEQLIELMIDGIRASQTTIDAIAFVDRNFEIKRKPL